MLSADCHPQSKVFQQHCIRLIFRHTPILCKQMQLLLHGEDLSAVAVTHHLLEEVLLQTKTNSKAGHDPLCDCVAFAHESHHVLPAGGTYIVIYVQLLSIPKHLVSFRNWCHLYTGNLNSDMFGDSENVFLLWGHVLGITWS